LGENVRYFRDSDVLSGLAMSGCRCVACLSEQIGVAITLPEYRGLMVLEGRKAEYFGPAVLN
jgi:hypothetical protein